MRREFFEHLLHRFVDWFFYLLRIVDRVSRWAILEGMRSDATPDSVLRPRVGQINQQRALCYRPRLRA